MMVGTGDRSLQELQHWFQRLGRAARAARLTRAGLRWLAETSAIWLAFCWLDNLLRLPPAGRSLLFAVGVCWPGVRVWRLVGRRRLWQVCPERVARELETRAGLTDNLLINACQFERAPASAGASVFASRTIDAGLARTRHMPAELLTEPRQGQRWAVLVAAVLAIWVVYAFLFPRLAGNAWRRISRPLSDVPPIGRCELLLSPAGRITVAQGQAVVFQARMAVAEPAGMTAAAHPVLRLSRRRQDQRGIEVALQPVASNTWKAVVENVQESFAARAVADDAMSPATEVDVRRRPRLLSSTFVVMPPSYTALPAAVMPGPPGDLTLPEGSRVEARVSLSRRVGSLTWQMGSNRVSAVGRGDTWAVQVRPDNSGDYLLTTAEPVSALPADEDEVAHGAVLVQPDRPPEVALVSADRNVLALPGERLEWPVTAEDDYGVGDVSVTARTSGHENAPAWTVAHWSYQGPPGRRVVRERLAMRVDPARFQPGESYLIEAQARDFAPRTNTGRSSPLILRVRQPAAAAGDSTVARALTALEQAIAAQRMSLGLTRNLELNLGQALQNGHLDRHRQGIVDSQGTARARGREALRELTEAKSSCVSRLQALLDHEMAWVLEDASKLTGHDTHALEQRTSAMGDRQTFILTELLTLAGRVSAESRMQAEREHGGLTAPPVSTADDSMRDLRDLLKDFEVVQKRVIEQSKSLREKRPEDLTDGEKDILGQLAREEQRWADLLKDKLNDLAKTPLQDFADGALASQFNEVWQDVSRAAEDLYAKKVDMAVPQEQSGLENAKNLEQNLERWMTNKPDYQKWSMEEPPQTPDAPIAELPKELEDIAGELLDKEEAMTEQVEDIASSWIDSLDKGAGWDAADGPISSMSAKGITGNQLPNQMEIGGRSGEGRAGRSEGQMVQSTAEGKDGRQTPARLSATPFESGSVEDKSKQDPGGATGGGKLSGFAGQGLRGPTAPPRLDQMRRLAGRQAEIRQAAEKLTLTLRGQALPSGDLEQSVARMREVEALARAGKGAEVRSAFGEAVGSLRGARDALRGAIAVQGERVGLPRREAADLWTGLQDAVPAGYEDLVADYYRRLVETPAPAAGAKK